MMQYRSDADRRGPGGFAKQRGSVRDAELTHNHSQIQRKKRHEKANSCVLETSAVRVVVSNCKGPNPSSPGSQLLPATQVSMSSGNVAGRLKIKYYFVYG